MFEHSPGSAHGDTHILHSLVLLLDISKATDSGWSKVGNMRYVKKKLQDLIHSRNKVEVMIINWPLTGSFDFKYHPWVPQAPPYHWTHGVIITLSLSWNDVAMLFWRNNDVIIASRVQWDGSCKNNNIENMILSIQRKFITLLHISWVCQLYPPYPKDRWILWFLVEAASTAHRNHVNAITRNPLDWFFSNLKH